MNYYDSFDCEITCEEYYNDSYEFEFYYTIEESSKYIPFIDKKDTVLTIIFE